MQRRDMNKLDLLAHEGWEYHKLPTEKLDFLVSSQIGRGTNSLLRSASIQLESRGVTGEIGSRSASPRYQ